MSNDFIAPHFKLQFQPTADPTAMVAKGPVRFTMLTSRIIRMEFDKSGKFEDRPSQTFWYRRQAVPSFKQSDTDGKVSIETEHLLLEYSGAGAVFTSDNLSIKLKTTGVVWHPGDDDIAYWPPWFKNLYGAARTLDCADGKIPMEKGLLSKDGWRVVDDSHSLVFDSDGWISNRIPGTVKGFDDSVVDQYFFGFGRAYRDCLQEYCLLTGKPPMIPRWALGNWWSRYWPYSEETLKDVVNSFSEHDVPLSVCIIDMDWHLVGKEYDGGWTGYTWNRKLFPDPKRMLDWLHAKGLKTALNLHPRDGVKKFEDQYPEMAKAMDMDPASGKPVEFDITDPKFTKNYFEILHHPHERDGVDFWWMDWQQGTNSKLPGLDPLTWLNHLHFYDLGRDGSRRPFMFSRWGGLGSHRYPIGFSGDTIVTWASLEFQPYFTATAANVVYGWWSHDIGGHMGGIRDNELYLRWMQYGVFTPIFRMHSTQNKFHERRPWDYGGHTETLASEALRLRHRFIPYIYSMAWQYHHDCESLVYPMYHDYPEIEESYRCPRQFMFGSQILAAPYVTPADRSTNFSRQEIWFPEGDWFDMTTNELVKGGGKRSVYGELEHIPIFARNGAIIPMAHATASNDTSNPEKLDIQIYGAADNTFALYEDDGVSTAFEKGHHAITRFTLKKTGKKLEFSILPCEGDTDLVPRLRSYQISFRGINKPDLLKVKINGAEVASSLTCDSGNENCVMKEVALRPTDAYSVEMQFSGDILSGRDRRRDKYFRLLLLFDMNADEKANLDKKTEDIFKDPEKLVQYSGLLTTGQLRALYETAAGKAAEGLG